MFWMSGPDKLCTWFNERWLEFTGSTLQQELGDGWSDGVHADDRELRLDMYRRAFDAQRVFSTKYRLRCADGNHRPVVEVGVPVVADGVFRGYIGSLVAADAGDGLRYTAASIDVQDGATLNRVEKLVLEAAVIWVQTFNENNRNPNVLGILLDA